MPDPPADNAPPPGLSPAQQRRGMRYGYVAQSCGMLLPYVLFDQGVAVLLLQHLGAGEFQTMLAVSLYGMGRIMQVPVSLWVHPGRGKAMMLAGWAFAGVGMAAATILAGLVPPGSPWLWVLVAVMAASLLSQGAANTFWWPLLHDVVPAGERGRFFAKLRAIWGSTAFLAILAAGAFLGDGPATWRHQVVWGVLVALFLLRNAFVARIPVDRAATGRDDAFGDWRAHLRGMLRRREVVLFIAYILGVTLCAGCLRQPMVRYLMHLGFPVRDNLLLIGCSVLGTVTFLLLTGRLTDRLGTRRVFTIAHLAVIAVCVAVPAVGLLGREAAGGILIGLLFLAGGMLAVLQLAATAELFHLAPGRGRAFFMSFATVLMVLGPLVSVLLIGALLEAAGTTWRLAAGPIGLDVFQLLFLGAGLLLAALLPLLRGIADRRPEAT